MEAELVRVCNLSIFIFGNKKQKKNPQNLVKTEKTVSANIEKDMVDG